MNITCLGQLVSFLAGFPFPASWGERGNVPWGNLRFPELA